MCGLQTAKGLNTARVARMHLVRMRPYCSEELLLPMYQALIWSVLDIGLACSERITKQAAALPRVLPATDGGLLTHRTVDALTAIATSRNVDYASMAY